MIKRFRSVCLILFVLTVCSFSGVTARVAERTWSNCGTASAAASAASGVLGGLLSDSKGLVTALGSFLGSGVVCEFIDGLSDSDEREIESVETAAVSNGTREDRTWTSTRGQKLTYSVQEVEPVETSSSEVKGVQCSKVTGLLTSDHDAGAVTENVACVDSDGKPVDSGNVF